MSSASFHNLPRQLGARWFTPLLQRVRRVGARAWSGSPELPLYLRMEQRFIAVRYSGIFWLAPTLLFLSGSTTQLAIGYALLAVILVYNVGVQHLVKTQSPWLTHGYLTTIGDATLCVAMIMIGGGF